MKKFFGVQILLLCFGFAKADPVSSCPVGVPSDVCSFEEKIAVQLDFKDTNQVRQAFLDLKGLLIKYSKAQDFILNRILEDGSLLMDEAYHRRAPKKLVHSRDGRRGSLGMLAKLREWERKNGQVVPVDWVLPQGVNIIVANLERGVKLHLDQVRYALTFFVSIDPRKEIEQVRVKDSQDHVWMDLKGGVGGFRYGSSKPDFDGIQASYVSASSPSQLKPVPSGIYFFELKLKSGEQGAGWFFLHGSPTTTPVSYAPFLNQGYQTANPTFRLEDYKTGSFRESHLRKRSLYVWKESATDAIWNHMIVNSRPGADVTLGQGANAAGVSKLEPGHYALRAQFEERGIFGEMLVGRNSAALIPFSVKP